MACWTEGLGVHQAGGQGGPRILGAGQQCVAGNQHTVSAVWRLMVKTPGKWHIYKGPWQA